MSKKVINSQGNERVLAPGGVTTEWLISTDQNQQKAAFQAQRILNELGIKGRSLTDEDIIGFIFDNQEGFEPFRAFLSYQSEAVRDLFGIPAALNQVSNSNISDPRKDNRVNHDEKFALELQVEEEKAVKAIVENR